MGWDRYSSCAESACEWPWPWWKWLLFGAALGFIGGMLLCRQLLQP